ncbi:MAG: Na+/H+ antiporter subunit E [Chloroflexi bacterium]|nr:Na+/H+ antiporter subunit E [Chloroflexota bacterium]MDA1240840.1 Na+/H+ antiporter subunit E [Chloroflexota bacterium]
MNNAAIANVLLALVWTAITGSFTLPNFVLGLVAAFAALALVQTVPGIPAYSRKTLAITSLGLFFIGDVLRANFRVTRDLISAGTIEPALLVVPTDAKTDLEMTLLVTLVTVTPGTTVIDVHSDGSLLVHFTNLPPGGADAARQDIRDGLERRVLDAIR